MSAIKYVISPNFKDDLLNRTEGESFYYCGALSLVDAEIEAIKRSPSFFFDTGFYINLNAPLDGDRVRITDYSITIARDMLEEKGDKNILPEDLTLPYHIATNITLNQRKKIIPLMLENDYTLLPSFDITVAEFTKKHTLKLTKG